MNVFLFLMELRSKTFEQIAFNARPKIEEHMLIVIDKSTHEEHYSQLLQTNKIQFKIVSTFLSVYNGFSNVANKNNKFIFVSVFEGAEFNVISISPAAYKLERVNKEIKRTSVDEK